jgi:hypothetical protein
MKKKGLGSMILLQKRETSLLVGYLYLSFCTQIVWERRVSLLLGLYLHSEVVAEMPHVTVHNLIYQSKVWTIVYLHKIMLTGSYVDKYEMVRLLPGHSGL